MRLMSHSSRTCCSFGVWYRQEQLDPCHVISDSKDSRDSGGKGREGTGGGLHCYLDRVVEAGLRGCVSLGELVYIEVEKDRCCKGETSPVSSFCCRVRGSSPWATCDVTCGFTCHVLRRCLRPSSACPNTATRPTGSSEVSSCTGLTRWRFAQPLCSGDRGRNSARLMRWGEQREMRCNRLASW